MLKTGDQIKINKGPVETLIKIERPYGLFKSNSYNVVRYLPAIKEGQWLSR
jgi:hypothetical protein